MTAAHDVVDIHAKSDIHLEFSAGSKREVRVVVRGIFIPKKYVLKGHDDLGLAQIDIGYHIDDGFCFEDVKVVTDSIAECKVLEGRGLIHIFGRVICAVE